MLEMVASYHKIALVLPLGSTPNTAEFTCYFAGHLRKGTVLGFLLTESPPECISMLASHSHFQSLQVDQ